MCSVGFGIQQEISIKEFELMSKRTLLRLISLIMFIIAVVFVFIALSAPTLGKTIYIGDYAFGAEQWRTCYKIYAVTMVGLFIASFFVKKNK